MTKRSIFLITLCLLVLLVFFIYAPVRISICRGGEKPLHTFYLQPGQSFTFSYKHSVEKTPVYEVFQIIRPAEMLLVETGFQSYGAGLPLATNNFASRRNYFVLTELNRKFAEIKIRVARTPGQTLMIKNEILNLQQLAEPGQPITIRSSTYLNSLILQNMFQPLAEQIKNMVIIK